MTDDRTHRLAQERSPAERIVERSLEDGEGVGAPLSRSARQRRRTLEAYFKAGGPPRWMERLAQIERGFARERRGLERAYRTLARKCVGRPELFARRWREVACSWRCDDELDVLIRQHNEWYPIERQLPIDPRTRDYVLIHGRSYRRPALDAGWVLEQFPPVLPSAAAPAPQSSAAPS